MPELRRHVAAAVILLSLAVGSQLAFTAVGQEIGPHWSEPTEVSHLSSASSTAYVSLASDGGPDGGAVAWIARDGGTYAVRFGSVSVSDGTPTVADRRTLTTGDAEYASVDVARSGDRTAVVWKEVGESRAYLWVDGTTRVVSANESVRVNHPSVTFVDGTPVVAYQEYYDGEWVGHVVAVPPEGEGDPAHARFGTAVRALSPSIAAADEGAVVGWIDTRNATGHVTSLRFDGESIRFGEERSLGSARTVRTMSGTGQVASVTVDGGDGGPVVLWTDLGIVNVRPLGAGEAGTTTLGDGQNPGFATDDGRWLATMVVTARASGSDIAYSLGTDAGVESGPVSRLPSNAVLSAPVFGDEPAVAWTESGSTNRLLVSAYHANTGGGPVSRLSAAPLRFLFIGVASAVVALVTVPLMPWVVGPLLAGFLLTTRFALDALLGAVARLLGVAGREASVSGLRQRLRTVPSVVPVALFAVVNVGLFVSIAGGQQAVADAVTFASPLGVSAMAAVAAVLVDRLYGVESGWQRAALFAYCQTMAAWATGLPAFM
ncbi:MAG: hypothetical protein ABEJ04_05975 [Halobacteriaceae archaeon]